MMSQTVDARSHGLAHRIERIRDALEATPLSIVQLLARIGVAAVFFKSGMTKIASWEFTLMLFREEYRVPLLPPELAAPLATATELSMPVLLALGLFARLATLPLLGMVVVIQLFVYPQSWAEHLTWTALLLLILTRGPGSISLDRLISPFLFSRKEG
ncbi:MAG TPA: DoxX family protein [Alphaproteobacteria bacterium]|nr:DoxX family protein [Alphaproteobacteria bacterium]